MGKFEENLEKNNQISDEFKKIAKQSFKEILDMLGREGFKKWIKMQTISRDVKSLIYKWADGNELEELESRGRSGDYNQFENKIRISKKITSPKEILGVSKHEDFHFFTRHGELRLISTYLDEGVTEYLKHLTEDADEHYTYKENVEVITFLREFMGDSIIQTYLEGKRKYFLNDLHNILGEELKSEDEREEEMNYFFDALEDRHDYLYEKSYEYDEFENTEKINNFFRKIILYKFRQMAKDRMFNRDGCVDEELAKEIISQKLKNARFVGIEYTGMNQSEIASYVLDEMTDKILLEVEQNYNPKSKAKLYYEFEKSFQERVGEDRYPIDEVFSEVFKEKTQMSIIEFSDCISKLGSEFNLPLNKLEELCQKYAFECFENPKNVQDVYALISSNIPRNNAVFDLLAKEITSTEPKFRKIGDSEYVEQRDDKFVYLKIDDDGTVHEETNLSKVKDIFVIHGSLESIRLVNREDDYRELGILDENVFNK